MDYGRTDSLYLHKIKETVLMYQICTSNANADKMKLHGFTLFYLLNLSRQIHPKISKKRFLLRWGRGLYGGYEMWLPLSINNPEALYRYLAWNFLLHLHKELLLKLHCIHQVHYHLSHSISNLWALWEMDIFFGTLPYLI